MADAKRDQNYVPTLLAVSSSDGTTPVALYADPTTHRLYVDTGGASGGLTVGTTTITSGTTTRILYDNAGVLGEYSVIPVSLGGTNATSASITAFNNITGYTAAGATGTTSTNLVFSTSPVLTTPTLGIASATSINKVAITAPATSATLTIADGKTLTVSNTLTLAGTDTTVMTFPTTSATIARTDAGQTFTGVNTMTSPVMVTSIDTSSTSFTAFAGATTLMTIGGTGASASSFFPSTLDTSSSITGAIRTSGGISAAKSANIGTTLTVGTGYQIGGAAASGKILKGNGTNFVASTETYAAPGTSGNVMTSDGTNWTSAAPSGGSTYTYTAQTGTYSILTSDQVVNCTSGTFTATLPTAVGVTGKFYYIKNTGSGVITIATTSSQTIDGDTTFLLTQQYSSIKVLSDGANWIII